MKKHLRELNGKIVERHITNQKDCSVTAIIQPFVTLAPRPSPYIFYQSFINWEGL